MDLQRDTRKGNVREQVVQCIWKAQNVGAQKSRNCFIPTLGRHILVIAGPCVIGFELAKTWLNDASEQNILLFVYPLEVQINNKYNLGHVRCWLQVCFFFVVAIACLKHPCPFTVLNIIPISNRSHSNACTGVAL